MADPAMTSVIDSLPARMRELFADVISAHDSGLLAALMSHEVPSVDEQGVVENILSNEFSSELGEDWEPSDRGKQIDDMLGAFLLRWPIQDE